MNNSRRFCAAFALSLVFTAPTFAGIISTDKTPPPPAPTTQSATSTNSAGIITTGNSESVTTDTLTQLALSLFQSLVTLF